MNSFLLIGSITCGLLALTVVGVMGWDEFVSKWNKWRGR